MEKFFACKALEIKKKLWILSSHNRFREEDTWFKEVIVRTMYVKELQNIGEAVI